MRTPCHSSESCRELLPFSKCLWALTLIAAFRLTAQESDAPLNTPPSQSPELAKREVAKEPWSRAGVAEFYVFPYYLSGDTADFSGVAGVEFDSTLGGGLGFGGNLGQHFNLNTDLVFARSDLTINYDNGFKGTGDTTIFGWNLNVDYNILKRRLTPFVTGGVGIYYFGGEITAGRTADFNEWDLSYGGGVGLRWDVSDHFLVKTVYRPTWTSLQDSDNTMLFHTFSLGIGFMF